MIRSFSRCVFFASALVVLLLVGNLAHAQASKPDAPAQTVKKAPEKKTPAKKTLVKKTPPKPAPAKPALARTGPVLAPGDFALTLLFTGNLQSRLEPVRSDGSPCTVEEMRGPACFGGIARLAGAIAAERARTPNVLVVDAGNAFTGSSFWDRYQYRALSRVFTRINIDAMAVSHSEFSGGSSMLRGFIDETRFPLLGANVDVQRDPLLKNHIFPIYVLERGSTRVGLVGFTAEDAGRFSQASDQTRFNRIEPALRPWIDAMIGGMKVNKVIGVSFAGLARDKEIAAHVEGLSVIVSGNNGTDPPLADDAYPLVVKGPTGQPVLIVRASSYGKHLGRIMLVYDRAGRLKSWSGKPILIDSSVAEDAGMRALVAQLSPS